MDDVYINIVMEYCNAGDLTGLLKQRAGQRLPEPEIMSLIVQVGGYCSVSVYSMACFSQKTLLFVICLASIVDCARENSWFLHVNPAGRCWTLSCCCPTRAPHPTAHP